MPAARRLHPQIDLGNRQSSIADIEGQEPGDRKMVQWTFEVNSNRFNTGIGRVFISEREGGRKEETEIRREIRAVCVRLSADVRTGSLCHKVRARVLAVARMRTVCYRRPATHTHAGKLFTMAPVRKYCVWFTFLQNPNRSVCRNNTRSAGARRTNLFLSVVSGTTFNRNHFQINVSFNVIAM